jgi:ATP-dependent protease HslVU (ClpYQ) peptidase subunit
MPLAVKCKACGSDDLQIELKGGEADDDSTAICKNCRNEWDAHRPQAVDRRKRWRRDKKARRIQALMIRGDNM